MVLPQLRDGEDISMGYEVRIWIRGRELCILPSSGWSGGEIVEPLCFCAFLIFETRDFQRDGVESSEGIRDSNDDQLAQIDCGMAVLHR